MRNRVLLVIPYGVGLWVIGGMLSGMAEGSFAA